MKKTLLASAVLFAFTGFALAADTLSYGSGETLTNTSTLEATISVTGNLAYLNNTGKIVTGTFDWFGHQSDQSEIKGEIVADEIIYRGINGNNLGRKISALLTADTLKIVGTTYQNGLTISSNDVLANVDAIRIESSNARTALIVNANGISIDAPVTLVGQDARIHVEDGASVTLGKLVAESGNGKIQVNHTASAQIDVIDIKNGAYMSLDMWTSKDDQTATFKLNEINVGADGAFRVSPYNDKKPRVNIEGDLTINLGKNGIVDLGGERNADWDSDTISINSKQIQVNIEDLSGENHVYLSKEGTDLEKTTVLVSASGESSSSDVNADLQKMAGIVELTSNTDVDDGNGGNVPSEKSSAVGTKLAIGEGMYAGAATATVGEEGKLANVDVKVNSIMSNVLDMASAQSLSINRILMNDVRKRMGDLRSAEGTHGVWARYDGGKFSGSNEYENDFSTIQVGIDTVPVADAPRFGVAFAYTTSDADMKRGGADMDAFSLAFYGTKMYDNGLFVDVIGRMATADTDVVVDGDKKASMDNVALSLSGELGWRFDVTEKVYFEPQAELTYTYVNAETLALSSGHEYKFDAVDSLVGRIGFAAGFKCPNNFGDVYVRASAVHEFLGDATVRGGTAVHEIDGEDTWVEFGVGAQFNVNKNTYVYADVERTEGAKLEEDWRANVGVRFAF